MREFFDTIYSFKIWKEAIQSAIHPVCMPEELRDKVWLHCTTFFFNILQFNIIFTYVYNLKVHSLTPAVKSLRFVVGITTNAPIFQINQTTVKIRAAGITVNTNCTFFALSTWPFTLLLYTAANCPPSVPLRKQHSSRKININESYNWNEIPTEICKRNLI